MTPEPPAHDLGELERLLAEATPGPWQVIDSDSGDRTEALIGMKWYQPEGAKRGWWDRDSSVLSRADARFIVAAANALPDLIAVARSAAAFYEAQVSGTDWKIADEAVSAWIELQSALRPFYGGGAR